MGDLLKPIDLDLALSIYLSVDVCSKVIQCYIETNQFEKMILYAKAVDYVPDYISLLRLIMKASSKQGTILANL